MKIFSAVKYVFSSEIYFRQSMKYIFGSDYIFSAVKYIFGSQWNMFSAVGEMYFQQSVKYIFGSQLNTKKKFGQVGREIVNMS